MSRIILPNGQQVNQDRATSHLMREVNRLSRHIINRETEYTRVLEEQNENFKKLDFIIENSLKKNDLYERFLIKKGYDPKEIVDGYESDS